MSKIQIVTFWSLADERREARELWDAEDRARTRLALEDEEALEEEEGDASTGCDE